MIRKNFIITNALNYHQESSDFFFHTKYCIKNEETGLTSAFDQLATRFQDLLHNMVSHFKKPTAKSFKNFHTRDSPEYMKDDDDSAQY